MYFLSKLQCTVAVSRQNSYLVPFICHGNQICCMKELNKIWDKGIFCTFTTFEQTGWIEQEFKCSGKVICIYFVYYDFSCVVMPRLIESIENADSIHGIIGRNMAMVFDCCWLIWEYFIRL